MTRWADYFEYDESCPSGLRWKVDIYSGQHGNIKNVSAGDVAGNFDKTRNYWAVTLDKRRYGSHIVVWEMFNGEVPEGLIVDHFDLNTSNNAIGNLRLVDAKLSARNKGKIATNTSGVTGVCFRDKPLARWTAHWTTLEGKLKQKSFSCNKYGDAVAFLLACEWRAEMIEQLNAQGAGYTERHGKE